MPNNKVLSKSNDNYNLLSRPKRSINYEKFDYDKISPDILKKLEDNDDESEDEDFNPIEDDDDEDEMESNQDDDESGNSTKTILSDDDDDDELNDTETSDRNDSSIKNKIIDTSEDKCLDSSKIIKNIKTKATPKIKNKAKSKKKNKANSKTKFELDDATQKIINSFRTTKIVKKIKSKNIKAEPILKNNNTYIHKSKVNNTGPYVKKVNHILSLEGQTNKSCLNIYSYVVCNHDESGQKQKLNNGDLINSKLIPPKDKIEPITDFDSAWICALCSNSANCIPGIGDLYGPYRVRINLENHNCSNDSLNSNEKNENFKEIWLHEGCSIWSANIYLKENQVHGIAQALELGSKSKCCVCKNWGATLKCSFSSCLKTYHYPCSIKKECLFDEQNYTLICKSHPN